MLEAGAILFLLVAQVLHLVLTARCMEHTQSMHKVLLMVVDNQARMVGMQSHTK